MRHQHDPQLNATLASKRRELQARIQRNLIKEHSMQIELVSWDGFPFEPFALMLNGIQFEKLIASITGCYTVYLTVAGVSVFCGSWSLSSETDADLLLSFVAHDFNTLCEGLLS